METSSIPVSQIGYRCLPSEKGLGGIEVWVAEIGSQFRESKYQFVAYTRKKYCDNPKNDVIIINRTGGIWTKNLETLSHSFIASLKAANQTNVVHYHGNLAAFFCPIPRLFGKKVVVTLHGADWERAKWKGLMRIPQKMSVRILMRFAHSVCSVSEPLAEKLTQQYGRDVEFIPNGVSQDYETPLQEIEKSNDILFLGRLVPEKRVEDIVSAVKLLDKQLSLSIVGNAPYMSDYVQSLIDLANDDPHIKFLPPVMDKEKIQLLAKSRILVCASEVEGMSLTLLEAARSGVTIVASDIPENRWIVERLTPEADKFLFQPRCSPCLAQSINYAFQHLYKQQWTEELSTELNWKAVSKSYAKVYNGVLNDEP